MDPTIKPRHARFFSRFLEIAELMWLIAEVGIGVIRKRYVVSHQMSEYSGSGHGDGRMGSRVLRMGGSY